MWLYLPPKKWTQIRVLFSNCSALDVPSAVAPEFLLGFPGLCTSGNGLALSTGAHKWVLYVGIWLGF